MPKNCYVSLSPQQEAELDRAFESAQQLVDWKSVDLAYPRGCNAIFTTSVTLLMLLYQRIRPEKTQDGALKFLLESKPNILPQHKRVVENRVSSNTGGYANARKELPLAAVKSLTQKISQDLIDKTKPSLLGRRVYFFDGTTMTLAPVPALQALYPPASNQHGEGVFPVALLAMAFELQSGAAVIPEIGAMYGQNAVSETALVGNLFRQIPTDAVVMGDAGFGIFSVAHEAQQTGHDYVLRLTASRFKSMVKKATLIQQKGDWKSYSLKWRPSSKDRKTHPALSKDSSLDVRLHEIRIHETLTLYLVTSMSESAPDLSELYRHRNDAEIDISNFKVVLNAETMRVKSDDMFKKELWMSLVSYNVVSDFRREAAQQAGLPARRLSFKRVLTTFTTFLLAKQFQSPAAWRAGYEVALRYAMKDKLPDRPGRSYEREAYHKRPKSSGFKKRERKVALQEATT